MRNWTDNVRTWWGYWGPESQRRTALSTYWCWAKSSNGPKKYRHHWVTWTLGWTHYRGCSLIVHSSTGANNRTINEHVLYIDEHTGGIVVVHERHAYHFFYCNIIMLSLISLKCWGRYENFCPNITCIGQINNDTIFVYNISNIYIYFFDK